MTCKLVYAELLAEYRFVLGLWTEAKELYPPDSAEMFQVTWHLELLEFSLEQFRPTTSPPMTVAA